MQWVRFCAGDDGPGFRGSGLAFRDVVGSFGESLASEAGAESAGWVLPKYSDGAVPCVFSDGPQHFCFL